MIDREKTFSCWQGTVPPQYIFANRSFTCVALDPPDSNLGFWIGAGKSDSMKLWNGFFYTR